MVARSARKSKTIKRIVALILLLAAVACAVIGIGYLFLNHGAKEPEEEVPTATIEEPEEPEVVLPDKVDFQPVVDEWVSSVGGNRSVLIYDLERGEVVGTYNTTEDYNTASLYKLFVVYEGYRRVQSGGWQADAAAGSTGRTILECLDLSIRESYSPCAETLWAMIGHDTLDEIIATDFDITNSDISTLTSNPEDIKKIMQIFYEHTEITDPTLIARMKDSFLNQPATTYDWRQGLPSGFSSATNVYNKVGWDWGGTQWNIYHDAAIVEFPEQNRHFIVVVMTNHVSHKSIANLGSRIEELYLQKSNQ